VKLRPPARKETDPRIVLPLPARGVLKRQDARPLEDFAPPFTFVVPTEAAHVTLVGLTAAPLRDTRTDATTVEPALGFAGETLTALAETAAESSPPVAGWTETTIVIALFVVSGSAALELAISSRDG
jgi:hypothetical protein